GKWQKSAPSQDGCSPEWIRLRNRAAALNPTNTSRREAPSEKIFSLFWLDFRKWSVSISDRFVLARRHDAELVQNKELVRGNMAKYGNLKLTFTLTLRRISLKLIA